MIQRPRLRAAVAAALGRAPVVALAPPGRWARPLSPGPSCPGTCTTFSTWSNPKPRPRWQTPCWTWRAGRAWSWWTKRSAPPNPSRSCASCPTGRRCPAASWWEGFAIESVLARAKADEAFFRATHGGAELDLLLLEDGRRLGGRMQARRRSASDTLHDHGHERPRAGGSLRGVSGVAALPARRRHRGGALVRTRRVNHSPGSCPVHGAGGSSRGLATGALALTRPRRGRPAPCPARAPSSSATRPRRWRCPPERA